MGACRFFLSVKFANSLLALLAGGLIFLCGKAITIAKGHEPMLYEALRVIAGPFFEFTSVKMKEPNKPFNH